MHLKISGFGFCGDSFIKEFARIFLRKTILKFNNVWEKAYSLTYQFWKNIVPYESIFLLSPFDFLITFSCEIIKTLKYCFLFAYLKIRLKNSRILHASWNNNCMIFFHSTFHRITWTIEIAEKWRWTQIYSPIVKAHSILLRVKEDGIPVSNLYIINFDFKLVKIILTKLTS